MIVKYLGASDPLCFIHGKNYVVLGVEDGFYRIIDETGEDYLYSSELFDTVERADGEPHLCPVCGDFEFECRGSDDICEVCGWQDDIVQELNPDEECCGNRMSLNQARKAWREKINVMESSEGKRVKCIENDGSEWTGIVDVFEIAFENEGDEQIGYSICVRRDDGQNVLVFAREIEKISFLDVKISHLDFKLIDAHFAGEEWAEDRKKPINVVEIYIDGIEIAEIFRKIELPYCEAENEPDKAGDYGHIPVRELYEDLIEATVKGSYSYELGVYPLCCRGCGEPGCWSVTFRVREDDEYVWWYGFEHEHRDWKYNLEFAFLKSEYSAAMSKLAQWKGQ